MNFYTPQLSGENSVLDNSFSDNFSPMIYATQNTIGPVFESAPLANAAKPETSSPANMNYDDFKSAVVALGLRNRPYDLSWENNANQLHSNMQQAELQMIDSEMVLRTKNNLSKRTGPYFRSQEEANGTDT
jgi:hypothetical protein